ncbi:hypothetical protein ACH5RR_032199 [Cinchona calisaya]|uniref:Uncharacterized protein n=1 Tax=Cinchona calisaya TaxID=153742 RepID=A0ABD2YHE3_9GENT
MRNLNFMIAKEDEELEFQEAIGEQDELIGNPDWMSQYSPITFDFQQLQIKMNKHGDKVVLRGNVEDSVVKLIRGKDVRKFLKDKAKGMSPIQKNISGGIDLPDSILVAIFSVQQAWMQEVLQSYKDDPDCLQLLTQLTINPTGIPFFQLVNGIKYSEKVYVGKSAKLKGKIIQSVDDSAIRECSEEQTRTCSLSNDTPTIANSYNLTQAWSCIAMDFIEKIPSSNDFDTVWIIIDKLIVFAQFIPLQHAITGPQLA